MHTIKRFQTYVILSLIENKPKPKRLIRKPGNAGEGGDSATRATQGSLRVGRTSVEEKKEFPGFLSFLASLYISGSFAVLFFRNGIIFVGLSVWTVACAVQAPEDYYFEFALMEAWGAHNRQQMNRQPGEIVVHPESTEPLVVAFEAGDSPTAFLGFVPEQTGDTSVGDTPTRTAPKVGISLQQEAMRRSFDEKGIRVIHWRLQEGRLNDEENAVVLNFIPRAFSDRVIMAEFLMICAIVHGAQLQKDTIDVIRGIAEKEDGTPLLSVEASTETYKGYLNQEIDSGEWEQRLRLRRF